MLRCDDDDDGYGEREETETRLKTARWTSYYMKSGCALDYRRAIVRSQFISLVVDVFISFLGWWYSECTISVTGST